MTKVEAGSLGGLARARNHSHEELCAFAKNAGRPRLPTLQELVAQQPPPKEPWWITLRRVS